MRGLVEKKAYDVVDAAAAASVSRDTIRKAIDAGDLHAKKAGVKILIRATDLDAWIDSLEDAR